MTTEQWIDIIKYLAGGAGVSVITLVVAPIVRHRLDQWRQKADAMKLTAEAVQMEANAKKTEAEAAAKDADAAEQVRNVYAGLLEDVKREKDEQVKGLQGQLDTMKCTITDQGQQIAQLRDKLTVVEQELKVTKQCLDQTAIELHEARNAIVTDQQRIAELEADKARLQARVEELERENEVLRSKLSGR